MFVFLFVSEVWHVFCTACQAASDGNDQSFNGCEADDTCWMRDLDLVLVNRFCFAVSEPDLDFHPKC